MKKQIHNLQFSLIDYLPFTNLPMLNNLLNAKCEMKNKTAERA